MTDLSLHGFALNDAGLSAATVIVRAEVLGPGRAEAIMASSVSGR